MTTQEGRAYAERWRLVRDAECEQLRRDTPALRFRQLCALVESRDLFHDDPAREREVGVVRARWVDLRRSLGA